MLQILYKVLTFDYWKLCLSLSENSNLVCRKLYNYLWEEKNILSMFSYITCPYRFRYSSNFVSKHPIFFSVCKCTIFLPHILQTPQNELHTVVGGIFRSSWKEERKRKGKGEWEVKLLCELHHGWRAEATKAKTSISFIGFLVPHYSQFHTAYIYMDYTLQNRWVIFHETESNIVKINSKLAICLIIFILL